MGSEEQQQITNQPDQGKVITRREALARLGKGTIALLLGRGAVDTTFDAAELARETLAPSAKEKLTDIVERLQQIFPLQELGVRLETNSNKPVGTLYLEIPSPMERRDPSVSISNAFSDPHNNSAAVRETEQKSSLSSLPSDWNDFLAQIHYLLEAENETNNERRINLQVYDSALRQEQKLFISHNDNSKSGYDKKVSWQITSSEKGGFPEEDGSFPFIEFRNDFSTKITKPQSSSTNDREVFFSTEVTFPYLPVMITRNSTRIFDLQLSFRFWPDNPSNSPQFDFFNTTPFQDSLPAYRESLGNKFGEEWEKFLVFLEKKIAQQLKNFLAADSSLIQAGQAILPQLEAEDLDLSAETKQQFSAVVDYDAVARDFVNQIRAKTQAWQPNPNPTIDTV